jgi:hypothetical protein
MAKQQFAEYAMWTFIATVILAGLYGPWMMSLLLSALAALCVKARRSAAAHSSTSAAKPSSQRRCLDMSRLSG